ncbi:MAG: homoserine dehydrogenase [Chromatiales bacterium]|nr:homoserine dehydrogenase [Chromatiales bacterium]
MKQNKRMKIGLLGLGTVGCGMIEVLNRNTAEIERRAGCRLEVVAATARDLRKQRAVDLSATPLVADARQIVEHPEIDTVVELIGGNQPAYSLIMKAIENSKHIVTANKALIANHGNEIFNAARQRGVMVSYEAAIAGGVPVIKAIRESLAANRIHSIVGIINGTSNYILTEVEDKQRSFAEALAEAQRLGYAEMDPSYDVDGIDTAHKLMIMAATAFGIPLQFNAVHIEGIRNIEVQDVAYAKELGYKIKHLGIAKRNGDGIELRVHPALIPLHSMLANVSGVMNAVLIDGDAAGETLYYGAGAGGEATASAVIADLIDVSRALNAAPEYRVPHLAFQPDELSDSPILAIGQTKTARYLRLQVEDKPGVLAGITRILSEFNISIEAVLQKDTATINNPLVPLVLLIYPVKECDFKEALSKIEALPEVADQVISYRLETG